MTENGLHNPPPPIRAILLGKVRISVGERVISDDAWSLRSARSLLLLLLITRGHAMPKERVLDTLWPEASPEVGSNALYKALHLLRRVLEPELTSARKSAYIETRGGTIGISPGVGLWVDADACEAALRQAMSGGSGDRRIRLREAVNLYGGELLPTDPYEDWPVARREALQHAWEGAVLDLADLDLDSREPEASVPSLELLLAIDPTVEVAHRALMRGYIAAGQRDRAIRQYARCVAALESELGIGPDAETQALHAAIKAAVPEPHPGPDTGPFNNLPTPPTAIVGRDREIDVLQGTLWRQDVRLVTLTGPGGVGKTRLALEAASRLVEDFADGVAFVPLAAVRDPGLVLQAITSTLGLGEEPNVSLAATLTTYLRTRELLLVLDNFEQVIDAATDIGDLLASCASLTVLVTSRERLQLRGEHLTEVPSLAVPRPERLPAPAMLSRYGAVAMFSQHMQRIDADFRVTPANSQVISAICRHLEGLPLAIELATARARFFTLDSLLDRLASRLDIEEGPRDLPARQRTLRATVSWSHDLLSAEEQAVFRRLGATIGGYTRHAAEAICGEGDFRVHGHLRSLAEKHLVRWEETDDGPRITMLETIREFAVERLRSSGEEENVSQRHAAHFLNLVTKAEQRLVGTDQLDWFERLEIEQGNIRSALDWSLERQDEAGTLASRATVALWRYWWSRGMVNEGIAWLERATARGDSDPHLRSRVLVSLAHLRQVQSDYPRAEALITEALPLSRQIGDQKGEAEALNALGEIAEDRGDFLRAAALYRDALAIYQRNGLQRESAGSLNNLASVAYNRGDLEDATTLWKEVLAIVRELGDHRATGVLLGNLGSVAMAVEDFDRAVTLQEENLSIARRLKDPGVIASALCNLTEALQMRGDGYKAALLDEALDLHRETTDKRGETYTLTLMANSALERGDLGQAARLYAESLSLCQTIGDRTTMAHIALLERIAALALACSHTADAARLLGANEALRDELDVPIMPYLRPVRDRCLEQAASLLGHEALAAAMAQGRTLSTSERIDAALAVCDQVQLSPCCDGSHQHVLATSPRYTSS